MGRTQLESPELYINRELSWLEFNDRVLREGAAADVPLLERLKFLAIVSANLDEFFMIRVAGLKQRQSAGVRRRDVSGMTPAGQLSAIRRRVRRMVKEQTDAIRDAAAALSRQGIHLLEIGEADTQQREFLRSVFRAEILPILTPLAVEELRPCPVLPGLKLYLALMLAAQAPDEKGRIDRKLAVVPVPAAGGRFITIPAERGLRLVRLEAVMADGIGALFPDCTVLDAAVFRITRDADVDVHSEDAAELMEAMEQAVHARRRRAVVRLEIAAAPGRPLKHRLMEWLDVKRQDVYEVGGMLDASALMEVANRPGFDRLKYPDWPAQPPRDLLGGQDLWRVLQDRDVLLVHPYESFDPVVGMLEAAAEDPGVLAIKQTLYRTSGDSPVIRALAKAAENGKQVTVLVELKARFDEVKNVNWARQLEEEAPRPSDGGSSASPPPTSAGASPT